MAYESGDYTLYDIWMQGIVAYVANFSRNLRVIDIRDPALPGEIGYAKEAYRKSIQTSRLHLVIVRQGKKEKPGANR